MSEKLICPWRVEAFISVGDLHSGVAENTMKCIKEKCAMWGVVDYGRVIKGEVTDVLGCRRRG